MLKTAFLIICILFPGCRHKQAPSGNKVKTDSSRAAVSSDSGIIVCTGFFEAPGSAIVAVTSPAGGRVKKVFQTDGSYVKSGSPLFVIEDVSFVKLQQEYLESLHRLDFFSEELKRQGELALEKAASLKKLQETELEYKICETRKASLEKQLALLEIKTDSLDTENLTSVIIIKAPTAGVFEQQISTGAYIGPEIVLANLRTNAQALLYAEIPESLFESVHVHQSVSYSLPGEGLVHTATIASVDQRVDRDSHCFRIRIIPVPGHGPAIPGMQVKVYINPVRPSETDVERP